MWRASAAAIRSRVQTHPRIRGLCHWAGEPAGHLGAESPSRRAAEHASAKRTKLALSALAPRAFPGAPRECGVPTPPCSALRLLSSPAHSRACPFAVARATQVYRRKRNQPGINQRAIALARSDHPTATGESAPSVTLPPTSPHVIVWCGDTPVVHRSLGDRCERHKRAPRLE